MEITAVLYLPLSTGTYARGDGIYLLDYVFGRKWARIKGKSRPEWLYHVAWLGYSIEEATWEPRRLLGGIRDYVDEFDAENPLKPGEPKLPAWPKSKEDANTPATANTKKKTTKKKE
jgi:hypothetical protein